MTDQPGTDLVYATASLEERKKYAEAIARAGSLLPKGLLDDDGKPSPGKVLLIAETGNMLSIHPIAALNGVNVIEGKPTISPALMSALVRRAGHKLRVTTAGTVEGGDFQASATLIRADDPHHPYVSTWTPHRAVRAGLCTYTQKDGVWTVRARSKYDKVLPWEAYTEALCKARAIGEACRDGAEDALMGVHYSAEELGAVVNEDGDVIDGEIVEEGPETGTPGDTGKSKARLRDPAATGPDRKPTAAGGSRPSPSRTVETSGAGRATTSAEAFKQAGEGINRVAAKQRQAAPEEPSEETRAAVADYVERVGAEDDIERLRDLHGDASTHGLLATPVGDGRRLNDVFYQRRKDILDQQEMPPALDGIEDNA